MKEITEKQIQEAVVKAFLDANYLISPDIEEAIQEGLENETHDAAQSVLDQIQNNYEICRDERMALCQDCGMALVFLKVGQDVHISGSLNQAVQNGVAQAYEEGYLRKSVVNEPVFERKNTGNNTPAIIYTEITEGEELKLTAVAKGFGSENCSRLKMFIPSDGIQAIEDFIVNTVVEAGSKSCPPVIAGVGIGGTMDYAALMAKKATARPVNVRNSDPRYAEMEERILERINRSGMGPGGLGGATSALAVNIEWFATHIASVPVAVNLCCHASRHATVVL